MRFKCNKRSVIDALNLCSKQIVAHGVKLNIISSSDYPTMSWTWSFWHPRGLFL